MATIKRFEEIQACQKARALVCDIYKLARLSPLRNDYELKRQICGAAVSSMSNIAEGFARRASRDFAHFLDMARGSVAEVESLLYVALDAEFLSEDQFKKLFGMAEETGALIGGFTTYLRQPRAE